MYVADLVDGTISRVGRPVVGTRDPQTAYRLASLLNGYEEPVTAQEAATVAALRRLAA
ncbi:hypothetical protein QP419_03405 [Corynebacterium amycolatum]|uniref:hypothetical protein n=1 Tax=Corynebacterium amycolatum TaxID=43765 RepID=UPI0025517783|nr:hypothetical protein [Corynebacterium amycolatum]MDK7144841.1 hypothetical protein [Corynebacterium amycolatum]